MMTGERLRRFGGLLLAVVRELLGMVPTVEPDAANYWLPCASEWAEWDTQNHATSRKKCEIARERTASLKTE